MVKIGACRIVALDPTAVRVEYCHKHVILVGLGGHVFQTKSSLMQACLLGLGRDQKPWPQCVGLVPVIASDCVVEGDGNDVFQAGTAKSFQKSSIKQCTLDHNYNPYAIQGLPLN